MRTILVVDDSPVDRKIVGGLLAKGSEMQVEYAANGVEALQRIQDHKPNLVVTDLMMPEMDGLELVARIASDHPLVPVILMTGRGSEEIAVAALKAGAASYVPKAELAQMLVETVENVMQIAREEQTQHRLMDSMVSSRCRFVLSNDFTMIPPLINFLHRSIRSVGLCDEATGIRVCVALEEALNNALFHGNLELSSEEREGDRDAYRQLIHHRQQTPPFSDRAIHVDVNVSRTSGSFVIRDEGPGFNPNDLPDPTDPANLEKASGRGLLLMRTFMDEISFNPVGNEVTMIKYIAPESQDAPHGESAS
jgi:CheY-like chemotaxis protein